MNGIIRRLRRVGAPIRAALRGRPLVVVCRRRVYKIALRSTSARQLAREARNSKRASSWPEWRDHVVELSLLTPFLASTPFQPSEGGFGAAASLTTSFVLQRLSEALRAPRASARDLLAGQQSNLGISEEVRSDLFSRYRRQVTGTFFDFEVPRTAMHGDFTPPNALVRSDGFLLVDWEYANEGGSVLFDAWLLRRSIVRKAGSRGDPDQSDPNAVAELDRGIDAFGLRQDQVDAFGHAMHALMDFARLDARGGGADALADSVQELERLAGGGSGSTAGSESDAA